jgi:hypothetical protein
MGWTTEEYWFDLGQGIDIFLFSGASNSVVCPPCLLYRGIFCEGKAAGDWSWPLHFVSILLFLSCSRRFCRRFELRFEDDDKLSDILEVSPTRTCFISSRMLRVLCTNFSEILNTWTSSTLSQLSEMQGLGCNYRGPVILRMWPYYHPFFVTHYTWTNGF